MAPPRRALPLLALLLLGAAGVLSWGRLAPDGPTDGPDGAPRAEANLPPSALAPDRPPALASDPARARARSDAVPRRLRVVWEHTGAPIPGARWRLDDAGGRPLAEGGVADDGTAPWTATAWDAWASGRLRVWGEGVRDATLPRPPTPGGEVVEVRLARRFVDLAGVVTDDLGTPLEGAGVVVEYWSRLSSTTDAPDDFVRTRTDARGRFALPGKVWHPEVQVDPFEGLVLHAGAPGHVPARLDLPRTDRTDLVVALARDDGSGGLEIFARHADGTPAAGAHAWLDPVPPFDAPARRLAEVWRDPDDPRPPGWTTWRPLQGRDAWHLLLDASGERRVFPVALGPQRLRVRTPTGAAEVAFDLVRPGAPTRVPVTLDPLREVTGRIRVDRDPHWACPHATHEPTVEFEGWHPLSGDYEAGLAERFLLRVPASAPALLVRTADHPLVRVPLPPTPPGVGLDLGEVVVPSCRTLRGRLRWPEGVRPPPTSLVRVVDEDGVVGEGTTFWTSLGGPEYAILLPRRPGGDAWILVRPSAHDPTSPELRFDGPFDFASGVWDLAIPAER